MSKSGKHGAVRNDEGQLVNSPAFAKRYKRSQAASKSARKARRRNR